MAELAVPPDPIDESTWSEWAEWGLGWWSSFWTTNPADAEHREEDFRRSMRDLYGYLWTLMDQFARLPNGPAKVATAKVLCAQLPRWGRYTWVVYGSQATTLRVLFPGEVRAELPVDAGNGYCAVSGPELAPAVPIALAAAAAIVAYVAGSAYECKVRADDNARILAAAERTTGDAAVEAIARGREAEAKRPGLIEQAGAAAKDTGFGVAGVVVALAVVAGLAVAVSSRGT